MCAYKKAKVCSEQLLCEKGKRRTFCLFTIVFIASILMLASLSISFAENSGTCGINVTWHLSDEGLLTISGYGPMADYKPNTCDTSGKCEYHLQQSIRRYAEPANNHNV